ncbi:pH-gated potassium channel KcsA [Candidatus Brocadiaceae bacterium]|nr:pH-gated potassium channel KcsA [Candidatus Brocadiaceae bacterium]
MTVLTILSDSLTLLKKLISDLSGKRSLFYLLCLAFAVSFGAGFMLYIIDPNVHSLGDSFWLAWITMTQVGFGDIVPTSLLGRILSGSLILFGLLIFSLCTAILSAAMIGKDMDIWLSDVKQIEQEANRIEDDENTILQQLALLHDRMERLENLIKEQKHD